MDSRQRHMAMRLRALREQDIDILFICGVRNWRSVMAFLEQPGESFDDSFVFPTVICRVREEDLITISPEIPYFTYLYEQWRDDEFGREAAIRELLSLDPPYPSVNVQEIYRYCGKLGLTEGQLYPDLFNILSAAKYSGNDNYAYKVLKKASSYSLADKESNCVIKPFYDYDFAIQSQRVLKIQPDDGEDAQGEGEGGPPEKRAPTFGLFTFYRTKESLQDESDFMRYLTSRYIVPVPSDEYATDEFVSGMRDGIDVRTTLRYHALNKIFVKEQIFRNGATYVVDFGGKADWRAYFDTQYSIVGAAKHGNGREEWVSFTAFVKPPETMQNLLPYIDLSNPLISCIDLALRYTKSVFVFTHDTSLPAYYQEKMHQIKVIKLDRLPRSLTERMRCFYFQD
jgi:hypothetical protein